MRELEAKPTSRPFGQILAFAGVLVVGLLIGRQIFPKEVHIVHEVEKRVEVPVHREVEKRVEVPVDRIVEKRIEVPVEVIKYVECIVEKRVEVPIIVERVVERRVEVPVQRSMDSQPRVERSSTLPRSSDPSWSRIAIGESKAQVKAILGEPLRTEGDVWEYWYYGNGNTRPKVVFFEGKVWNWLAP